MTPEEIITRLSDTQQFNKFPKTALEQARQQWPEVYPHIQQLMRTFNATEQLSEGEIQCLFFGIQLLADQKEYRAFEDLIELCKRDDDFGSPLEHVLGDLITETLPTMFFILSQKEPALLFSLIEHPDAGPWVKLSALRCVFSLVEAEFLATEVIVPKLEKWIQLFEQQSQDNLLTNLAMYCITYQLDEVKAIFLKLFREDKLARRLVNDEELENWQLKRPVKDIDEGHVKSDYNIMVLEKWAAFSEPKLPKKQSVEKIMTKAQVYNPQTDKPKAGRNDPCPCGSGKKYKKCCLQ